MTLEQAIRERWEADAALVALVPSERVFASFVPPGTARPWVVVERRKSRPAVRSSSGLRAVAVELVLVVEAESYDVAAAIAGAMADEFDGAGFDAGEGRVAAMRRGEELRERASAVSGTTEAVRWELRYEVVLVVGS